MESAMALRMAAYGSSTPLCRTQLASRLSAFADRHGVHVCGQQTRRQVRLAGQMEDQVADFTRQPSSRVGIVVAELSDRGAGVGQFGDDRFGDRRLAAADAGDRHQSDHAIDSLLGVQWDRSRHGIRFSVVMG